MLDEIPIIREYPDVCLNDIPNFFFTKREIEFSIELVSGAGLISTAPYSMFSMELVELKGQLEELSKKRFVRLSASLWGALVLFVEKKDRSIRLCMDYR